MSPAVTIINRKFNEQRKLQSECRRTCEDEYVFAYAAQILDEVKREVEMVEERSSHEQFW